MTEEKHITEKEAQILADKALIDRYGGPAAFARKLGLTGPRPDNRVGQWTRRGIPARIKLKYPRIFRIEIMGVRRK